RIDALDQSHLPTRVTTFLRRKRGLFRLPVVKDKLIVEVERGKNRRAALPNLAIEAERERIQIAYRSQPFKRVADCRCREDQPVVAFGLRPRAKVPVIYKQAVVMTSARIISRPVDARIEWIDCAYDLRCIRR